MEGSPVAVHAVCILLAVLSSGLTEMFVQAAAGHQGVFAGLFQTTTQNVLKTFPIEVSLDGWVGSTWILLNVWTAGWLVYAFSTVIRRNIFGPICCNPEIHPPSNYLIWIFINTLRICWVFLWDRQHISVAIGVKMLVPICSYYMLFVSYHNLHRHNTWLTINCPNERWYIRFMTQNGLALFASWTFIEALINVGVALKYRMGLPDPLVSAIVLTVLLLGMLLWFVFESFVFSQYILYTFTVFPVAVLCLGAMFTNSYRFDDLAPITIYCGFLMIVATVLNSIRLVAVCFYKQTKPAILSLPSFLPAYNGNHSLLFQMMQIPNNHPQRLHLEKLTCSYIPRATSRSMTFINSSDEERIDRYAVGSHQENVLFAAFYIVVFILAVPGNILALWVFARDKNNTPAKIFLKNLAVADISYLAMLPMRAVYHLTDNNWPLGEILCRVLGYLFYLNMYCSLYFMAFISLDRFIALVLPVRSVKLRKPLYASVGSAILWLCLIVATMPLLLSQQTTQVYDSNSSRTVCRQLYREKTSPRALVSVAVAFSIPLVTITVSYILILHRLWSRVHQEQRFMRRKATRLIVLILVNFLVAFMPYHISRFIYIESLFRRGDMASFALCNRITSSLTCISGVLDPVMYFFLAKTYRNTLLQLFHRNKSGTT